MSLVGYTSPSAGLASYDRITPGSGPQACQVRYRVGSRRVAVISVTARFDPGCVETRESVSVVRDIGGRMARYIEGADPAQAADIAQCRQGHVRQSGLPL